MSNQKFLALKDGAYTEVVAVSASNGVEDGGKVPCLNPTTGTFDLSMMPKGIAPDTGVIVATEVLQAGNLVNIYADNGAFKVQLADASTNKPAMGYVNDNYAIGENATVYFEGTNKFVTGITPGKLFLSTTPGLATGTVPTASGDICQIVGFGISATKLNFQYNNPITLA